MELADKIEIAFKDCNEIIVGHLFLSTLSIEIPYRG